MDADFALKDKKVSVSAEKHYFKPTATLKVLNWK
jgi:hypothetical protein